MSVEVDIDPDAVDLIATRRRTVHAEAGNHRPAYTMDSMTAERIGVAAECAFAIRYGLPSPDAELVDGDDGFDFVVDSPSESNLRVEIKASEYREPSLMLSDQYQTSADRYVVASVRWPTSVCFVGWVTAQEVDEYGTRKPSQFGGEMDVVETDDLNPLPDGESLTPAADPRPVDETVDSTSNSNSDSNSDNETSQPNESA